LTNDKVGMNTAEIVAMSGAITKPIRPMSW